MDGLLQRHGLQALNGSARRDRAVPILAVDEGSKESAICDAGLARLDAGSPAGRIEVPGIQSPQFSAHVGQDLCVGWVAREVQVLRRVGLHVEEATFLAIMDPSEFLLILL